MGGCQLKRACVIWVLVAMVMVMCVPFALADSDQDITVTGKSGSTIVNALVSPQYIVHIPQDTKIPYGQKKTIIGTVSATQLLLEKEYQLEITMQTSNRLVHVDTPSYVIPFTSSFQKACIGMQDIDTPIQVDINISSNAWQQAHSGAYQADLVFEIACVPVQPGGVA